MQKGSRKGIPAKGEAWMSISIQSFQNLETFNFQRDGMEMVAVSLLS